MFVNIWVRKVVEKLHVFVLTVPSHQSCRCLHERKCDFLFTNIMHLSMLTLFPAVMATASPGHISVTSAHKSSPECSLLTFIVASFTFQHTACWSIVSSSDVLPWIPFLLVCPPVRRVRWVPERNNSSSPLTVLFMI